MVMTAKFAIALALLAGADAFAPIVRNAATVNTFTPTALSMVDGPEDGTRLASGKKEIGYDEKTGRFFETGKGADECIPDDEYCAVDEDSGKLIRLTLVEKERIFLDAVQSYYVSGRQLLPDDEFDILKEDLSWNGSKMVQMNRNEAQYIAAKQAFTKGSPIMSDKEFDDLKATLKEENSVFAVSTEPKCYIDTGICTVTMKEDRFRGNLLYLPVGAILSLVWLGVGFEIIEPLIRINPLLLIALGSPLIVKGSKTITDDYIFTDNQVVYGPCPSCEAENRIYFGGILGVDGFDEVAEVKCPNCKSQFSVQRSTLRASTLPK